MWLALSSVAFLELSGAGWLLECACVPWLPGAALEGRQKVLLSLEMKEDSVVACGCV